jgi:hypothetical protein
VECGIRICTQCHKGLAPCRDSHCICFLFETKQRANEPNPRSKFPFPFTRVSRLGDRVIYSIKNRTDNIERIDKGGHKHTWEDCNTQGTASPSPIHRRRRNKFPVSTISRPRSWILSRMQRLPITKRPSRCIATCMLVVATICRRFRELL